MSAYGSVESKAFNCVCVDVDDVDESVEVMEMTFLSRKVEGVDVEWLVKAVDNVEDCPRMRME